MYQVTEKDKLNSIFNHCIKELKSIGYIPQISYIDFNTRMIKTHGIYCEDDMHIEISYKMFMNNSDDLIHEIVMHELTHNLDHILNGKCSDVLDGHGESWQRIVDNINKKLGTNITRFSDAISCAVLDKDLRHHYVMRCKECNNLKQITSKSSTYGKARKPKCDYCGMKNWEFVDKGQLGIDTKTFERIIIKDKY